MHGGHSRRGRGASTTRGRGHGASGRRQFRGRGRGRGRGQSSHHQSFQFSRLNEEEDGSGGEESLGEESEDEETAHGLAHADEEEEASESEPEQVLPTHSYQTLLQTLNTSKRTSEPARKKRKLEPDTSTTKVIPLEVGGTDASDTPSNGDEAETARALNEEIEADEETEDAVDASIDSDDEEVMFRDPFEKHYSAATEKEIKEAAGQVESKAWQTTSSTSESGLRVARFRPDAPTKSSIIKSPKDMFLKQRILGTGTKVFTSLKSDEKYLAAAVFGYDDVLHGCRDVQNTSRLRDLSCLHALNHVFKTRDRVLKNNSKLSAQSNGEILDLRDQGFTRPKVLIMVPTKQACVRFVDSIVKLSEPDQQENKSRFLETYTQDDSDEWLDKPEDFRQLFGGNHEEDFRIGLKFTRKTIKYFAGFYNSDIIIGSPLGLMRTITTGGGGKNSKKTQDADFLSSIEVVIVDHANALQMQNWQHVDYVFSQLNLLPKDSHGCDFSRVRHWYLDGQAKYLRQTIILSDYLTPEINALASTHLKNISGRIKLQPEYPGEMLGVSSLVSIPVSQTFLRLSSPSAQGDSDARFKFFTTSVLPPFLRDPKRQKGTLLFVPTYVDFVRLRNFLSTSSEAANLSFGLISEYASHKEVLRARSHFLSGRHTLLVYSERAHHHFRYKIRGVKKVIFYGVPENPIFWSEVAKMLDVVREDDKRTKASVRALFSKWDAMKLERIVGTQRVGRLINDRGGDVFDFV
ncbi:hypothetical protein PV10_05883 [Exophiala mesophila]|uniref:U3 small nucleolar RNA-associated protein 25 n=1 Tax=Exophiala mesophila TaxID=212818 RepID=A0A0D1WQG0_EXOME|nr:uncharacterized protein PV10_05883 [Exophiala mesophila]KIV91335.1 hypothetical protein PV10_05883 [Exophiala mesophila]